ncbi:MAG TPA: polymer-forming cytoskeletal protein [Spirochaetia bacterium]|nr:polymer-forming cytoskeletal protein [Spirochaetia bacterium]
MSEVHIKNVEETELDTILADDIDFAGELSFKKPLMIKGRFKGQINASGDLYIGEEASVEAQISARLVSLKGSVKGNVNAQTRVELFSTSRVEGDITSPEIIMESGSRFNGICSMEERKEAPSNGA